MCRVHCTVVLLGATQRQSSEGRRPHKLAKVTKSVVVPVAEPTWHPVP